jgi:hypothetical protein
MNRKNIFAAGSLIAVAMLMQAATLRAETSADGLKLHLPREIAVKDKIVRLGDITVASGKEDLIKKAADIPLGTISLPGQRMTIDRYTIMTRLGSSGFDTSLVTITGAEKVSVTLIRTSVGSSELLAMAEKFALSFPLPADQRLHALDMPADVNLSGSAGKLEVIPSLTGEPKDRPLKIKLRISLDGKELATRDVRFTPVPRIARVANATPASTDRAGQPDSPKVVFRNQPVVIELEIPGLRVTAMGLPLEDGRSGQLIKVRNIDSKRDIIARVKSDGTVSPVI